MPFPRWAGAFLLLLAGGVRTTEAIYPDGHFDHVTKINDADHFDSVSFLGEIANAEDNRWF